MNKILWFLILFLTVGLMIDFYANEHMKEEFTSKYSDLYVELKEDEIKDIQENEIMSSCFIGQTTPNDKAVGHYPRM